jgi:diguanylate cyclase (GGDEF)-like protein
VHVLHVDPTPGKFAGQKYQNLRNHFTYSFVKKDGADPGRAVPCRRSKSTGATDTVARLAGDEFVIILEGLHTPEEAKGVAQKIIAGVEAPFSVQGQPLSVSTSIGIAVYQHGNGELSRLSIEADEALYRAKAAGRNGFALYGDR